MGCDAGRVVSVNPFYSRDRSSNIAAVFSFILLLEKNKYKL